MVYINYSNDDLEPNWGMVSCFITHIQQVKSDPLRPALWHLTTGFQKPIQVVLIKMIQSQIQTLQEITWQGAVQG